MKVIMTLLVRDETDIVDAQIAFHLHAGVDFVVATDNRSQDGTVEILQRYERAGVLHLLREDGDDMRQDEWVTRMARLAATEFEADWVVNADADEFWWPRAGSLKQVFGTVPERYGILRGCWRHFLPRPDNGAFFAERMTVRLGAPAFPGDKLTIFHAHQKVAHRADPGVAIEAGNHNAVGARLEPIRAWHPLEVLHFSFRSPAQIARKARGGWVRNDDYEPTQHQLLLDEALREERVDAFYDSFVVTDEALERGLAGGTLAVDTRLRDALRTIADGDGGFRIPVEGEPPALSFPHPGVREDAAYAGEASVLVEIDGVVRAEKRVEALEERLAALERGPLARRLIDWPGS
jgi:Glycosyl transferase family 2